MSKLQAFFFYFSIFIVGAVILVIEIAGTRILTPFYGSTIFVWSSIIAVTLLFLSLGYFIGGIIADKKPDPDLLYWIIFFAGASILLIPKYSNWLLIQTDKFGFKYGPLAASFSLFFIPLSLLGMVSPLAIKIGTKDFSSIGVSSGSIYALATIGSLSGALATGFFLIPNFPISRIINVTGLVLVIIFFLWKIQSIVNKKKIMFPSLLIFIILATPPFCFNCQNELRGKFYYETFYHAQSFHGDIKIVQLGSLKCLFVDGIGQSCNSGTGKDENDYLAKISSIARDLKPKKILALGMGSGSFLLSVPKDSKVDVVEIDQKVVEMSKRYDLIPQRDYKIYYDDARHFIKDSNEDYDLIIMDLFIGGNIPSYMLSRESFSEIRNVLSENGVFYIHIPVSIKDKNDKFLLSVYKTLADVFSRVKIIELKSFNSIGFVAQSGLNKEIKIAGELDWTGSPQLKESNLITDDFNLGEKYYLPRLLSLISYYSDFLGRGIFLTN